MAKSNRHPHKLYEGGLNREHFLPFINMLEKYCVVHHMGGDFDADRRSRRTCPRRLH